MALESFESNLERKELQLKKDKLDAKVLADLARTDFLPTAYYLLDNV